jgi:glycosyltransferase involved in cell wall biosynthesis
VRIAIDLRYATDHFPGISQFAIALLALLDEPGEDRFDLLWNPALPTSHDLSGARAHPRVRWVETSATPLGVTGALKLGGVIRSLKPDVYLSPYWQAPIGAGTPLVLTLHDVLPLARPQPFDRGRVLVMRLALRWLARRAQWLTVSHWSHDEILRHVAIPAARLHVLATYRGPARHPVSSSPPAGVPSRPFALAVGINKPHKNLAMLREVWARLDPASRPDLVWAGPRDPRHGKPDDDGGARAGIHALGRVSEGELDWLYRHALMFLFPTTYEGLGLPLQEAMMAGTPVIGSDIPPLREVGGEAVIYVPPTDPGAWSAAVTRLAADAGERDRLSRAGRLRASLHEPRSIVPALRAALNTAVGRTT